MNFFSIFSDTLIEWSQTDIDSKVSEFQSVKTVLNFEVPSARTILKLSRIGKVFVVILASGKMFFPQKCN